MSEALAKKHNAKISIGFWGSKQIDPYELLISKAASEELARDRSVKIPKKNNQSSRKTE